MKTILNGLPPPQKTHKGTFPDITKQISCLNKQIDTLTDSFTNQTGEHVGKVTDEDALHEIDCLQTTKENLIIVRQKQRKCVRLMDLKSLKI